MMVEEVWAHFRTHRGKWNRGITEMGAVEAITTFLLSSLAYTNLGTGEFI